MSDLHIRVRGRTGYAKEAGGYIAWTEYQVCRGKVILDRCDTMGQAERFLDIRQSAPAEREIQPPTLSKGAQRHVQKHNRKMEASRHG